MAAVPGQDPGGGASGNRGGCVDSPSCAREGGAGARRGGERGAPRGGRRPEEGRTLQPRPPARTELSPAAPAGRDLGLRRRRKRAEARAMLRLASAGARTIVDMSYARHFLDFQGSAIPHAMQKLVVTRLSPDFREAVTLLRDCPVPLPGDGDLLVRNR